ncbi:hypothetical protein GETHLI_02600 [Geothrix limicola]|uniref:Outer membrane protein beta-barrel domain-containing protein n=1 Tax=Geothrix limicola TaxID=2927978 RepID=A0ABQ5QBJ1_9BACT|nr:hypothetical protein [Geothrix limicola]GLH71758.1 hypothetical protein GETHLI_02600 [Geothrix limicola]
MTTRVRIAAFSLALAVGLALPAKAQSFPDISFKIRAGNLSGPVSKDSLGNRTTGFGVEAAFPLSKGRLTTEITYDVFNGYRRDTTQYGSAFYAANQDPWNPTGITRTYSDGTNSFPVVIGPEMSLQGESMTFKGFGLKVGYQAPLPFSWAEGWDWQAGLSLDYRQTHHEIFMTLTPGYYDSTHTFQVIPRTSGYGDWYYYEGANYSKDVKKVQPGAYAGVSRTFSDIFRLELNLRETTFNGIYYHPFSTTGAAPRYSESTKNGLVLEVALGVRL